MREMMTIVKTAKFQGKRPALLILAIFALIVFLSGVQSTGAQVVDPNSEEPYDLLVNNVFFDVFITDAIRDVSLETGISILTDQTVSGFVTLDLFDVPLPDALRQIALSGGYTVRWMDGFYVIGSASPQSPLFHMLSVSERVRLNHIVAEDVPRMLIRPFNDMVRIDPSTNSAIVTGPPDTVARIIEDIKQMDQAPYQIKIDAVIVEVTSNGRRALGLDWGWQEHSNQSTTGAAVQFTNLVGNIGYSLTGGFDRFLLTLQNQVSDGNAKIRAHPNIVALEGKPASLFVGKLNYYRILTGTETTPVTRLEAIEAGVSLEILARVADDDTVILELAPSVSDVQGLGVGDLPVIGRRSLETTVRVKDGETFGVGGLLQEMQMESETRVPILGSLPIIGRLFSIERTQTEENELIVLITPHIIREEVTD